MSKIIAFATVGIVYMGLSSLLAQAPRQGAAPEPMKPLYALEDAYLKYRVQPADQPYSSIDGNHLKEYVKDQTAISRRYRDAGHEFWGRIIGSQADAESDASARPEAQISQF